MAGELPNNTAWKEGKALAYGIGTSATQISVAGYKFYATSMSVQAAGDMKEYKDNIGKTCGIVITEATQTIQMTGYLFAGGTGDAVKKGDTVTNLPLTEGTMTAGQNWRVQDFSVNWQNEDVANVNITIKRYAF